MNLLQQTARAIAASAIVIAGCSNTALPPRVEAFAALPDWSGEWLSAAATAVQNPVGHIEGADEFGEMRRIVPLLQRPPLKPDGARVFDAIMNDPKALTAGQAGAKLCRIGFPLDMAWFDTFQVAITPEETFFIFDSGEVRYVYTDGRSHPTDDDLLPSDMGDSIGHWDGDTLVVDTIGRTAGPLKASPVSLSASAHFTEHLRKIDENTLQDQLVIEDPEQFTQPWAMTVKYTKAPGQTLIVPWSCDENDRNPVVNGVVTLAPPK